MDIHEVTNAQFSTFVEATNYKTIAEQEIDWEILKKQLPKNTPNQMMRSYNQDQWFL